MKKVFSDQSKVAHLWANKEQDEAMNQSRSFYFWKETIYSYGRHFPIAKHVHNQTGNDYILFTERGYSNTTAKHISITYMACRNSEIVYCCNPDNGHESNFKYWHNLIDTEINKLGKARKPEIYLNKIENIANKVKRYSQFTGAIIPEILIEAMKITDKDQFEQAKQARKKAEQELKQRHAEQLEKWMNFETGRLYSSTGNDYLRFNSENERVETTQAVQIPNEIAKRLWLSIKENTLKVGDRILNYSVNEAGKNVKIGCHTFKRDYLLQFGAKLYQTA